MPSGYVGSHTCKIKPKFANCSTTGCTASSVVGKSDSITLRAGFPNCYKHLDTNMVEERVANSLRRPDLSRITVIFYHLGLAKDGQVEQLSAVSSHGERFSSVIRTTVRANTSPTLGAIPPEVYNVLAEDPKEVMMSFCRFIRRTHLMKREGDMEMRNIILMAHAGYCKDHVHLLRTMMGCGITPPDFRFADSLLLFMMYKGSDENADVASLVAKHAARL